VTRGGDRASLVVQVGDDLYAIPCTDVMTVVPVPTLQPVPAAPRSLVGTFSYRGDVVPVIDLAIALGGAATADRLSNRVVLSRTTDGLVGTIVSRVVDIRQVPSAVRKLHVTHHPAVTDPSLLDGRPIHFLLLDQALPADVRGLVTTP
jgi:chemotaxis-related protein WspB